MTTMKFEDQDLPDDGSKLALFRSIHARLRPGAPFVIIDGVGVPGDPQTDMLRRIWKRHAMRNGVDEPMAEGNAQNFNRVPMASVAREEELLASAGFKDLASIFRALAIQGWLAFA